MDKIIEKTYEKYQPDYVVFRYTAKEFLELGREIVQQKAALSCMVVPTPLSFYVDEETRSVSFYFIEEELSEKDAENLDRLGYDIQEDFLVTEQILFDGFGTMRVNAEANFEYDTDNYIINVSIDYNEFIIAQKSSLLKKKVNYHHI